MKNSIERTALVFSQIILCIFQVLYFIFGIVQINFLRRPTLQRGCKSYNTSSWHRGLEGSTKRTPINF